MLPIIPYILTGIAGFFLSKITEEKPEKEEENKLWFSVWIQAEYSDGSRSKNTFLFGDFSSAKEEFQRLSKSKKVFFKDLVEKDKFWMDYYKNERKDFDKEHKLSESLKILTLVLGYESETFERIEFE